MDRLSTRHLQMMRQDGNKGIRHNEVHVLRIGLMQDDYLMYVYNVVLLVIDIL